MDKKPVFIHSLFRTGSTYIWNKFRQSDRYYCYYEPFHQDFVSLSREHPDLWEFSKAVTEHMHFPDLERSLTFEYRSLFVPGENGLPLFRKSFSFDEYCYNGSNPRVKKYLDSLIANAKDKIPVLKFNRSSLRIRWFKSNYPESVNLYLVRHPHDQFHSYLSMMKDNGLDVFLIMDLMIAGKNQNAGMFKLLASRIPLVDFPKRNFQIERLIYGILGNCYSIKEKYYIFYFIWLYSYYENVLNADLIVNLDLLTSNPYYREKIVRFLRNADFPPVEFQDARIHKYQTFLLEKNTMREIEQEIQSQFFRYIDKKEREIFFAKASSVEQELFNITETASPDNRKDVARLPQNQPYEFDDAITAIADVLIRRSKRAEALEIDMKRINSRLVREQQEVNAMIRSMDALKDHQISKLRKIHLMKEKQKLEMLNEQLAVQSALLDQNFKGFGLRSSGLDDGDEPIAEREQWILKVERELTRGAEWFEEKERELQKKKSLLMEKSRLLKHMKRQMG